MPFLFALIAAVGLGIGEAGALEVDDLYRAEAIVTGTEEPERTRGFRIGLTDLVVKLTGDARLEGSRLLAPWLDHPHGLVEHFEYEDRMKGLPVNDEQGTRERPHDLRMQFDAAKVDRLLRELGLRKWPGDRPVIALWLGVRTGTASYVLTAGGGQGYGQRAVFEDTARRRGLPVVLPPEGATIGVDELDHPDAATLRAALPAADAILLSRHDLGVSGYWDTEWTFSWQGHSDRWSAANTSFDSAIKQALQRAALVLSGQPAPAN